MGAPAPLPQAYLKNAGVVRPLLQVVVGVVFVRLQPGRRVRSLERGGTQVKVQLFLSNRYPPLSYYNCEPSRVSSQNTN